MNGQDLEKKKIDSTLAWSFGLLIMLGLSTGSTMAQSEQDWRKYGNDLANTRFQNLDQINPNNVHKLQVAWVFHTVVLDPMAALQPSPIKVGVRLFITDGHDNVFALNAATRNLLWKFLGFSTHDSAPF